RAQARAECWYRMLPNTKCRLGGSQAHKVANDLLAVSRQYALGMELHALEREFAMPQSHDYPVPIAIATGGRDLQLVRQVLLLHNQRVIARSSHRRRDAAEDGLAVVLDGAGLAVHQRASADDLPAESLADGLVAEAHAQHRGAPGKMPDQFDADACV